MHIVRERKIEVGGEKERGRQGVRGKREGGEREIKRER